ncbi:hypothetical protein AX14_010537, partial [Amanita brunnescens Koide BX004]
MTQQLQEIPINLNASMITDIAMLLLQSHFLSSQTSTGNNIADIFTNFAQFEQPSDSTDTDEFIRDRL